MRPMGPFGIELEYSYPEQCSASYSVSNPHTSLSPIDLGRRTIGEIWPVTLTRMDHGQPEYEKTRSLTRQKNPLTQFYSHLHLLKASMSLLVAGMMLLINIVASSNMISYLANWLLVITRLIELDELATLFLNGVTSFPSPAPNPPSSMKSLCMSVTNKPSLVGD